MKKLFGVLTILMIASLVLMGCSNMLGGGGTGRVVASDNDRAVAVGNVKFGPSERTNASGPGKITSNAHSADYPGIFFFWDSKQKDDGLLKVEAAYFDHFDDFVLTVKDSSVYIDFLIILQEDQKQTEDGYYTFIIPRDLINDKNINMVWVDKFVENRNTYIIDRPPPKPTESGVVQFQKVVKTVYGEEIPYDDWKDEADGFTFQIWDGETLLVDDLHPDVNGWVRYEGEEIDPNKTYTIKEILSEEAAAKYGNQTGELKITQSELINFTILSGWSTPEGEVDDWFYNAEALEQKIAWGEALKNAEDGELYDLMMGIKDGENQAQWVWDIPDPISTGVTGSSIIINVEEFYIQDGWAIPDSIPFYFACDNAAVVYVNGSWAGCTWEAFGGMAGEGQSSYHFATLNSETFDGDKWCRMYSADIAKLLHVGKNTITIYAANSQQFIGSGHPSEGNYDTTNNPAGLIFACSFDVANNGGNQFVNEEKEFYGFWAAIHLDFSGSSWNPSSDGTATVTDGTPGQTNGQGWGFTYFRVDELSKYDPLEFYLKQNGNTPGKVILSVNANNEIVITIEGITLKSGNEVIKVMVTNNEQWLKTHNQGDYTFKAKAPAKNAEGQYVITIPKKTFNLADFVKVYS